MLEGLTDDQESQLLREVLDTILHHLENLRMLFYLE